MNRTTLLHDGWRFARADQANGERYGYSTMEWLPATVPGHVHLDLMEHGAIPDPNVERYELAAQWVDEADWCYETTFEWSPDKSLPNRVLRFEGLDTVCDVILNGKIVMCADNMFVAHELDVAEHLVEGTNTLRIDFVSAARIGRKRMEKYFADEGLGERTANFHERSFVRKCQCMFGWDWGPRLVSCGIWKPVKLIEYAARILDVAVTTEERKNGWRLSVATEIAGDGVAVHVLEGGEDEPRVFVDGTIDLKEVELWDPTEPNLYTLTTYLVDKRHARAIAADIEDGMAGVMETQEDVHERTTRQIGFRTVRLLREKDRLGESFEFEVNGRKLYARGANWIPDHSFPSTIDRARLRNRLEHAKDMGMNMLRIWGGGLYESDAFYELCDEIGILVWQDFAFACAYYPEDPLTTENVRREAISNIKRLRHHPSLALWCGNNENLTMWDSAWGGIERRPPRYYGDAFYSGLLPELLGELDPARPYVDSSPTGRDPEAERPDCNTGGFGDQHTWDVWHGRGDWRFYTDSSARFSSEFGFCSSCSPEAWKMVFPNRPRTEGLSGYDLPADHTTLRWHDKSGKTAEVYHGFIGLHYPRPETLDDLVYLSQLNQRDALRHGIEHFRRGSFCRGTLIWQLNDIWPVQCWSVLDYAGVWKAAAHELVRLYDDRLVSLERDGDAMHVHAVNDGTEEWVDQLAVVALSTVTGEELRVEEVDVRLRPGERRRVASLKLRGLNVAETLVAAEPMDAQAAWRLLGEPKETRFGTFAATLKMIDEGEMLLSSDGPLVDAYLWCPGGEARFLDNFVTLGGAGDEVLRVEGTPQRVMMRSLAGMQRVPIRRHPE